MRPICLPILVAVFFGLPAPAWSAEMTGPPLSPTPSPPEELEMRAELIARHATTLSSEISARIVKCPLREGDLFEKGDLLVAFNCDIQQAKLSRAKAVLAAEGSKSKVLGRLDSLNVTSKLELAVAKAEEEKAQADLAIIRAEMEGCQIFAPFAGQVVTMSVREHQYVKTGETVMDILDPHLLELAFNMPSRWLQRFSKQHRFLIRIDETAKSYPAKIVAFGAKIDAVSQQVKVIGEIIGHFQELRPGMSGRVTLGTSKATSP